MAFEWDEIKATENVVKHGIRFAYAARVFDDPYRLEPLMTAKTMEKSASRP